MNTARIALIAWTSFALACTRAPTPDASVAEGVTDGSPQALVESALMPTFTIRGESVVRHSLADRMAELGVPGVSVAVLVDGEIAWARGYGLADVESGRPVTPNTLFQAASISKPVAALAALRLVEAGRVDLDGDVNAYLTSWRVPESWFTEQAPVTLRGLLTHRAGLTVWGFPGYGPDDEVPDGPGILDGRGNTDPVRSWKTPGESWRYSGGGYTVMQQLVADMAGKPFATVMRGEVLDPIGMSRSTYEQPIPPERQTDIATGYRPSGNRVPGGWHTYPEQAAAGLWTTPSELALYAREMQRAWRGESTRVLGQALVRAMLTPDEDDWGLGPAISADGERFQHGGSNQGFRCTFAAYIDGDDGVFVMTNSDSGSPLAAQIAATVAHAYGWSGPLSEEKVPVEVSAEVRERYLGTYVAPELGAEFRFQMGERGLELRQGPAGAELWPLSDSSFFDRETGREVHFSLDGEEMAVRVGSIVAIRR
ncbi:serine hydrolase domain-containing protein [Candidatus Palauibacter sp.]|uniref:serine hydrolase domain-containing protein n=1 Tax=Candidatus Palauibacter sp. TaxID=3101350 RepID=UPI003B022BA0